MSRPIHVEESVTVARSPEAVWSVVADYGTDTEWRKGLTDMTPAPPANKVTFDTDPTQGWYAYIVPPLSAPASHPMT